MKSILFVDDEPSVLRGLAIALRKERTRWNMVFAIGADAALLELAGTRFDAIVTDLQMPGMDGIELLARVIEDQPTITRFVLSGNAEKETLDRVSRMAHVVLGKPCPASELVACLMRTLATEPDHVA